MATRVLDIADGFSSAASPTQGSLQANSVPAFIDDAAYVTDKGSAAAAGDLYFNTTAGRLRRFDGTDWNNVVDTDDTLDVLSPTTTKGDLVADDGVSSPSLVRVAVGSNGQSLVADSSTTSGLAWQNQAMGTVHNLGVTLSAGTFSISSSDGTALSSTNLGFVKIANNTSGEVITLSIDANASFEDDNGTSDIIGEEFGVSSGIAWGNDRPFYIYAINSDDTASGVAFAISPKPNAKQSPVTANIGYHGNPASSQSDDNFFFLTATDVTATHNEKPCVRIGGLRMQMSASDDWTVQALSDDDGISSSPYEGTKFVFPRGQMTADSNNYFVSTGTAPAWTTPANLRYDYYVGLNGAITVSGTTQDAGNLSTSGVGTATAKIAIPYLANGINANREYLFIGRGVVTGASLPGGMVGLLPFGATDIALLQTNITAYDEGEVTGAGDDFWWAFTYQAFEA